MKKTLITVAIALLASKIVEVQAFKKASAPKASGVTGAPTKKPDVPAQKPAPVLVLSEAELAKKIEAGEKLIAQSKKLYSDLASLAMSMGNRQDALRFYMVVLPQMIQQPQEPDFSKLPLRAKRPLTEDEKATIKEEVIDVIFKRGKIRRPAQDIVLQDINAKLDAASIEHDDDYFKEYMNSRDW